MSSDLTDLFKKMKSDHERHRDRLSAWKAAGGELSNLLDGETIDDLIARENSAVENLDQAIELQSQNS